MELSYIFFASLFLNIVASWELTYYATITTTEDDFTSGGSTTLLAVVTPTATVTPVSTSTELDQRYQLAYDQGSGAIPINVTDKYLILPNVSLPLWTGRYTPSTISYNTNTRTNYYAPITIINPSKCTITAFTYTDSISVILPGQLILQATDPTVATFVTTYIVTLSTDLGGQVITTTQCDVYLNSQAVPNLQPSPSWTSYLSECVDPRHFVCRVGGNQAAAGTDGCYGPYPPTGKNDAGGTLTSAAAPQTGTATGTTAGPQKTGGATGGCGRSRMGQGTLAGFWALVFLFLWL